MPFVTKPTLRTITLAAAATLAATLAATPASAALNAFLKIGGTPAPHAAAAARSAHKDWIEVTSWSWGTSNGRKGWDGSIKGRKGWDGSIKGNRASAPLSPGSPPASADSLRVKVRFPWLDCRVGAAFPDAMLDDASASYAFSEVVVTRCDSDALSLGFAKVTVRGWDPAKKEE